MNAKPNFKMPKQSLEDQLKIDHIDKDDETVAKTASLKTKVVAEDDLAMLLSAVSTAHTTDAHPVGKSLNFWTLLLQKS